MTTKLLSDFVRFFRETWWILAGLVILSALIGGIALILAKVFLGLK